jgi:hypothetical protein
MTVTKTADGKWRVGNRVFESNAEVWREADMRHLRPDVRLRRQAVAS